MMIAVVSIAWFYKIFIIYTTYLYLLLYEKTTY